MQPAFDWFDVSPGAWLPLLAGVLVAAAALALGRRRREPWRLLLRFLAVTLFLRVVFFENPISWDLYARFLDQERLGWRQYDVIRLRRDVSLRNPAPPRYLAVGSSQTGRIYTETARSRDDLDALVLAGMTPADLALYRDVILRRNPQTVLLYLSDFDLARPLPEGAAITAPRQGASLLRLWPKVERAGAADAPADPLFAMAVAEIFPEYKYGFVLRGIVDEFFHRAVRPMPAVPVRGSRASVEQRVEWLRESFDASVVDANMELLEVFLGSALARQVDVVIVEGRYSPLVGNADTEALRVEVRDELQLLADRTEGVRYVPSDALLPLGEAQFDDLTHVTFETGRHFARNLLALLDGEPVPRGFNPAAEAVARDQGGWFARVERLEERIRQHPEARLLFLGDSITQGWEREGRAVWERNYSARSALNLGVGGDRTEHLLWRLRNSALETLDPKVAVVLIGTNNLALESHEAGEIVGGVAAVVGEIRERLPGCSLLLLGIFPRGLADDPLRPKLERVNRGIAALDSLPMLRYADWGDAFLDAEGNLSTAYAKPDRLHLNESGYELWARLLEPVLTDLMEAPR